MGALDRTISRRTGRRGRVLRRRQPDDDHNATRFARVNRPRVARYFDQERAVFPVHRDHIAACTLEKEEAAGTVKSSGCNL